MRAVRIVILNLLGVAVAVAAQAGDLPDRNVLATALTGYHRAVDSGEVQAGSLLTIIDYTLPSTEPRLFVYDPAGAALMHTSLVAHGKNSGANRATRFGNENGSRRSSVGLFVTLDTYEGRHGYSLRLRGLEPGFNDNAFERNIVIHGADYVSEEFIEQHGRLGRSWGCPALPEGIAAEIIDLIKDGTCVYIHGNDENYLENSEYVAE